MTTPRGPRAPAPCPGIWEANPDVIQGVAIRRKHCEGCPGCAPVFIDAETHPEAYDKLRASHVRIVIPETGHVTKMCRECQETFPCATAQLLGERDGLLQVVQAAPASAPSLTEILREHDAEQALLDRIAGVPPTQPVPETRRFTLRNIRLWGNEHGQLARDVVYAELHDADGLCIAATLSYILAKIRDHNLDVEGVTSSMQDTFRGPISIVRIAPASAPGGLTPDEATILAKAFKESVAAHLAGRAPNLIDMMTALRIADRLTTPGGPQ